MNECCCQRFRGFSQDYHDLAVLAMSQLLMAMNWLFWLQCSSLGPLYGYCGFGAATVAMLSLRSHGVATMVKVRPLWLNDDLAMLLAGAALTSFRLQDSCGY
jgi:hypothetical protein